MTSYDGDDIVEGEWKDGKVNGKVVRNLNGNREEYEAKDGRENGQFIRHSHDGRRR